MRRSCAKWPHFLRVFEITAQGLRSLFCIPEDHVLYAQRLLVCVQKPSGVCAMSSGMCEISSGVCAICSRVCAISSGMCGKTFFVSHDHAQCLRVWAQYLRACAQVARKAYFVSHVITSCIRNVFGYVRNVFGFCIPWSRAMSSGA